MMDYIIGIVVIVAIMNLMRYVGLIIGALHDGNNGMAVGIAITLIGIGVVVIYVGVNYSWGTALIVLILWLFIGAFIGG